MDEGLEPARNRLMLGDWIFRDARFAAMQVPRIHDAVPRILPPLVRLDRNALRTIFVAHYPFFDSELNLIAGGRVGGRKLCTYLPRRRPCGPGSARVLLGPN